MILGITLRCQKTGRPTILKRLQANLAPSLSSSGYRTGATRFLDDTRPPGRWHGLGDGHGHGRRACNRIREVRPCVTWSSKSCCSIAVPLTRWKLRANHGSSSSNILLRKLAVSIPDTAGTVLFSYIEIVDCFQALGSLTRKRGEEKPSSPSLAKPLPRSHGAKGRMADSIFIRISKAHQGPCPLLAPRRHSGQLSQNRSKLRFWCGEDRA
jgi:hypothetical protein